MPNTHSTLTELFTNIASAIRGKTGSSSPIIADAFPAAINAIPSGGDDLATPIIQGTISGNYENLSANKIRTCGFFQCGALQEVNFPSCSLIGYSAFYNCISLESAIFPICKTISTDAFGACSSLQSVSFPICETLGSNCFNDCRTLRSINFPSCKTIGSTAFRGCSSLQNINFPVCTTIGASAFQSCTNLTTANFPVCTSIGNYAFRSCWSLTTASFPVCTSVGSDAFQNCRILLSLYLLGSSVPILANIAAFSSTPISNYTVQTGGVYGSIIVQESMISAFQTATNWSKFSSRFSVWNGTD